METVIFNHTRSYTYQQHVFFALYYTAIDNMLHCFCYLCSNLVDLELWVLLPLFLDSLNKVRAPISFELLPNFKFARKIPGPFRLSLAKFSVIQSLVFFHSNNQRIKTELVKKNLIPSLQIFKKRLFQQC
jgi:hypothetical protein